MLLQSEALQKVENWQFYKKQMIFPHSRMNLESLYKVMLNSSLRENILSLTRTLHIEWSSYNHAYNFDVLTQNKVQLWLRLERILQSYEKWHTNDFLMHQSFTQNIVQVISCNNTILIHGLHYIQQAIIVSSPLPDQKEAAIICNSV